MKTVKPLLLYIYRSIPPRYIRFASDYNRIYSLIQQSKHWSIEKIRNFQYKKMVELVNFAYNNTSGYRQLYDSAGVVLEDMKKLEDFNSLPCIDKQLMRDNIDAFTVHDLHSGKKRKVMTGGSSGTPFEFFQTSKNGIAESAFINSTWETIGWKESDVGIKLRGAHIGTPENLLRKEGYRRYAISSSYLTEDNYEKYISLIEHTKASFMHVYPSSLTDLAKMMIDHKNEGRLQNVKHIFLGSENFYSWQEDIIRQAFPESKLISFYGLTEHTVLASWMGNESTYFVNPIYGYTELIKDGKTVNEGEIGEIVGTSFWNRGTIFIRYRSNDFAELGGAKEPLPTWITFNRIDGRLSEIIVGKKGRRISLTVFAGSIMHGKAFTHIKQFRFVQNELGHLELLIVPTLDFVDSDETALQQAVNSFLGNDFTCSVKKMSHLEVSKRGKFSYLEQHLDVDRCDINI